jgi:hypothetical protein
VKPPKPEKRLLSEELEQDARDAGVSSDELIGPGGDTHLPASESDAMRDERARPNPERDILNLPPG